MTNLKAIECHGQIVVKDTEDGFSIWWPNDEAQAEIQQSDDPKAAAVAMCDEQPTRGQWAN